jgi:transposase
MTTKRYKRNFDALEQRRKKAAQLLQRGTRQADVARELGVSRQTVSNWAKALSQDKQAWRRKPLGYPPALGPKERKRLDKLLSKGPGANGFATELWTLQDISELIAQEFGVTYGKTNVWLILKSIGFSCQKVAKKATQRNKQMALSSKTAHTPALKKSRVRTHNAAIH